MRTLSYKNMDDDTKIDMTPMLDIVFIMLIFFIVTASFLKESGIPITVPEGKPQQTTKKVSIIIEISETDDVWLGNRRIDVRAIVPNLKRRMSELNNPSVVIRVNPDSKNNTMMTVVDKVREAGVTDFVISPIK